MHAKKYYQTNHYIGLGTIFLVLCAFGLFSPLNAAQNIVITPTVNISAPATSGPIGSSTDLRIEGRIIGYTSAPSVNWQIHGQDGGWYINITTAGKLAVDERRDTWGDGDGNSGVSLSGRSDFLFRIQRDTANKRTSIEIWDTSSGSNRAYTTKSWATTNAGWVTNQFQMYTPGTGEVNLAWLRIYSTVLDLDAAVPKDSVASAAPIADWRFEGNLNDSSVNNYHFSGTGATYSTTPVLAPSCGITTQAFKAGVAATLNSSKKSQALNNATTLNYFWTSINSPYLPTWASRTLADAQVIFPSFGQWDIQLSVVDSDGNKSTCTSAIGTVGTDANDVVIDAFLYVTTILGPQIKWGSSPWPYFDERHKAYADLHGEAQNVVFIPFWETAEDGTVTVVNGSTTVSGVGTDFQNTFCNGGSIPVADKNPKITFWYRVGASTGRRSYPVVACASATSLTLSTNYLQPTADSSAVQYSASSDISGYGGPNEGQSGLLSGNSTNINFYDNVLAYYSLYYRSGLTVYRDYARWLASKWWRSPVLDEGRACSDGFGGQCTFPRNRALNGLILYALESNTDIWTGLHNLFSSDIAFLASTRSLNFVYIDPRERGYIISWLSLCAILSPDGTKRSECAAAISAEYTYWSSSQDTDGKYLSISNGHASWNSAPGTASVTNGSNIVTGTGTAWTEPNGGGNFWIGACNGLTGDIRAYDVASYSPTSLTLTENYEGTTGSGKCFQINNITGINTSPFILGVPGRGWDYATALSSTYGTITYKIANWIIGNGIRVAERGLKYNVGSPSCYTASMNSAWCIPGNASEARTLSGEGLNSLIFAYLRSGDANIKIVADDLFGALWDFNSVDLLNTTYYAPTAAKWLGFFFGFGAGAVWPAARLGGQAAEDLKTYSYGFKLPTGSDRLYLEILRPSGEIVSNPFCTTSPCEFTYDARQGPHKVRATFKTSGGVIRAQGSWSTVK